MKILPILISNIIVAVAVWAFVGHGDSNALVAEKDAEITKLKEELSKRQQRTTGTTRRTTNRAAQNSEAAPEQAERQTQQRRDDSQRFKNFRQMRQTAAINRLSMRLKLSDEQKAQINSVISERGDAIQARLESLGRDLDAARAAGQDTSAIEAQIAEQFQAMRELDPEKVAAEMLSDEQKAQYEAYQRERIVSRAETGATMSMAIVQEIVPMNAEQKDKYFAAYTQAAMNSENGRVDIEQTREILKSVLTPEEYSAVEEQISNFQRGFGRGLGGFGGFGGNRPPQQRGR